jgi:hypothetical protein
VGASRRSRSSLAGAVEIEREITWDEGGRSLYVGRMAALTCLCVALFGSLTESRVFLYEKHKSAPPND